MKSKTDKAERHDVWAKTVPVDIFRCGVCLLVGRDVKELKKAFCEVSRGCVWDDDDPGSYFDKFMSECESAGSFMGITVAVGGDVDKIVWLPKWDECVLVHECVHAADLILRDKGVDDVRGEMRAYLAEYLFGKFTSRM